MASPAGRFRRGDHLPEGEIVAIVITIVTGIIEIIINIIPNTSTISIFIQISSYNRNLCCNSYYLSSLLHRCWLLLCGECYWVLLEKYYYVQIVYHIFIPTDHDLFYVLWVVTLVYEDMEKVLLLVVICCWSNMCCLILKLCCHSTSGVVWVEHPTLRLIKDLGGYIVYKECLWWVAGVTETWTPVRTLLHKGIMDPRSYCYG